MTITEPNTASTTLTDDLLLRFRSRAAAYDAENRFFTEDFEELVAAGYLKAAVPVERGGWGLTLAQLTASQRRLARYAPSTALATTMHHYWVGLAVDLERAGDPSCTWILDDVAAGEVFAAGHAESGNDAPLVLSTTAAERVEGGYRLSGRKHFGSLSPVWTRFGAHAMDVADPTGPKIVHAFVTRDDAGVTTVPTWDTLGMRATQSHDTVLDGVFVPDARVGRVLPAGDASDLFDAAMSAWALTMIGSVYIGIAERAFEIALESARTKTAISIPQSTYATHPFIQHQVSEMYLALHAARATVDAVAADWTAGVDHGEEWAALIFSAKWRAAESAQRVVALAMDVVGGGSFFRRSELERLYRDVRASAYHPPTDAFAHEAIGKVMLGVDPNGPRW